MKTAFHWRWIAALIATLALVHPAAFAQPRGAVTDPVADAGVSEPTPSTPALTSGADAGTAEARPATSPDSVFGAGAPAQVVAPRPDPTPAQVTGFRTLEEEVNGFLSRGGGFRDSINGLLRRHHERQLARMRAGFDRQIQAERAAEGEARRHAIQVFRALPRDLPRGHRAHARRDVPPRGALLRRVGLRANSPPMDARRPAAAQELQRAGPAD
jgi:hypothetical protein